MNWLQYLAEANIYLSIFYLCYCLVLRNETHYTLNRIYLLFSCVVSFIIPLLQIGLLKPAEAPILNTTMIIPGNLVYAVSPPVQTVPVADISRFTLHDGLLYAYVIGVGIFTIMMVVKLYKLFRLSNTKTTVNANGYKLVYINESNTAFSFFNYLFIGTKASGAETIIRHELVHIRQKHSVDIILLEFFKIINWFNPLIYLLQNSLKTVHEYIADEQTAANDGDTITYSSFLVDNAYGISGSSITHSFFNYNLLKKRIIMLNQQRSGSLARLKYLVVAPLCAGLLCVSTLAFSKTYGLVDLAPAHELNAGNVTDTTFLSKPKFYVNNKGFLINEKYYAVNGKKYFRTIISAAKGKTMPTPTDKSNKLALYLGEGNASGEEMIYYNYGYKFPNVEVTPSKIGPPLPPPVIMQDKGNNDPSIDSRNSLSLYASNHIIYPKAAIENEITGKVIAKFTVDGKNKIKDIELVNSLGYGCKEQVISMLKSYPGVINGKFHEYLVAISFDLYDRTKDNTLEHKPIDPKIINAPNLILGMRITEYGPNTKSVSTVVPPPPPPQKPKVVVKFPPPAPPVKKIIKYPPPSIISDHFTRLGEYLSKKIKYPVDAKQNKVVGGVVAQFDLNNDHKITNVAILKGIGHGCDEEVANELKSFTDTVNTKPGTYKLGVNFNLYIGDHLAKIKYMEKDHMFMGELIVMGYVN